MTSRSCWTPLAPCLRRARSARCDAREPSSRTPARCPGVVGTSPAALRRAAIDADGWLGIAWLARLDLDGLAAQLDAVRDPRSGEGLPPAVAMLKLPAAPEVAEEMPATLESLQPLGFDEVIVEPPWVHGIDAA